MKLFGVRVAVTGITLAVGGFGLAVPVQAHTTGIHDNCTNLNKQWPHGVGRAQAVDRSSGKRVTNFYRNTVQYNLADAHNGTLDRDNDGIACEKA
jgi:hypothetical protein